MNVEFCQCFVYIYLDDHVIFILQFINMYHMIDLGEKRQRTNAKESRHLHGCRDSLLSGNVFHSGGGEPSNQGGLPSQKRPLVHDVPEANVILRAQGFAKRGHA